MPLLSAFKTNLMELLVLALSLATFSALFQEPDVNRRLKAAGATIATGVENIFKAPLESGIQAYPTGTLPAAVTRKTDNAPRESTAVRRARYTPHVIAAARAAQINPALIHAVILAESAYDPSALSRTGAVGLMQLMPATALRYGVTDRWDPEQNIQGGSRYLRDLLRKFDNDLKLTIAAYNAGEGAVARHGNRIPPYRETKLYVPKVLAYYKQYRVAYARQQGETS